MLPFERKASPSCKGAKNVVNDWISWSAAFYVSLTGRAQV
jgi:hypothetical protein